MTQFELARGMLDSVSLMAKLVKGVFSAVDILIFILVAVLVYCGTVFDEQMLVVIPLNYRLLVIIAGSVIGKDVVGSVVLVLQTERTN
jgi:hypothetical protein